MSISQWFQRLTCNYSTGRRQALETKIACLERQVEALICAKRDEALPPVIIQHVEKVIVEKLEYSNNFGALGIKELSGKLNIGTNYSGPLPAEWLENGFGIKKSKTEPKENNEGEHAHNAPGPRVNMRAKP